MSARKSSLRFPKHPAPPSSALGQRQVQEREAWILRQEEATAKLMAKHSGLAPVPGKPSAKEEREATLYPIVIEYIRSHFIIPAPSETWRAYIIPALTTKVLEYQKLLEDLAETGNQSAASAYAQIGIEYVNKLNSLVEHPGCKGTLKGFRAVASQSIYWVMLISPHRHFNQDERVFFSKLGVSHKAPLKIEPEADWNPNDPVGKLVLEAYRQVCMLRAHRNFLGLRGPLLEWEDAALRLPALRKENEKSANAWWGVLKMYFDQSLEKLTDLNRIVPKSKVKKRGGTSSHVFTRLKQKFFSMVGLRKYTNAYD